MLISTSTSDAHSSLGAAKTAIIIVILLTPPAQCWNSCPEGCPVRPILGRGSCSACRKYVPLPSARRGRRRRRKLFSCPPPLPVPSLPAASSPQFLQQAQTQKVLEKKREDVVIRFQDGASLLLGVGNSLSLSGWEGRAQEQQSQTKGRIPLAVVLAAQQKQQQRQGKTCHN